MIVKVQPNQPSKTTATIAMTTRTICRQRAFKGAFFSLKENIGKSLTISAERIAARTRYVMSVSWEPIVKLIEGMANAHPIQKSAFEGTGRPRKEVACRVSLLNFARRRAAKAGRMNIP